MTLDHNTDITIKLKTTTYFTQFIESFNERYLTDNEKAQLSEKSIKFKEKEIDPLIQAQREMNAIPLSELLEISPKDLAVMQKKKIDLKISFTINEFRFNNILKTGDFTPIQLQNNTPIYARMDKKETVVETYSDGYQENQVKYTMSYRIPADALADLKTVRLPVLEDHCYDFNLADAKGQTLLARPGQIHMIEMDDSGVSSYSTGIVGFTEKYADYNPLFKQFSQKQLEDKVYIICPLSLNGGTKNE